MTEENKWQLTILRPGFIWGPGHGDLAGIGQRVGPVYFVFGPGRAMPLSYVENTAGAFASALENPSAAGEIFNVLDPQRISAWRYAGTLKHRGPGSPKLRFPVPYFVAMTMTRLAQWTSRLMFHGKGKLPSILVPCRFEARFKPVKFSDHKLRTQLNFSAPLSFEQALERTYAGGGPAARTDAHPRENQRSVGASGAIQPPA